jgi:hypothetical protein
MWLAVLAVTAGAAPAACQAGSGPDAQMLALQAEGDPARRAKATVKYGESQLALLRAALHEEDFAGGLKILEQYRDAMQGAFDALRASGRNAEKKPDGFKQMQIHLRQTVSRLGPMVLAVPPEFRPPFEKLRKELEDMDKALMEMLFPPRGSRSEADRNRKP